MKVLITGGGGFLGNRLAHELLKRGTLANAEGKQQAIAQIVLLDIAFPVPTDDRLKCVKGDPDRRGRCWPTSWAGIRLRYFIWHRSSAAVPKRISTSA